MAAPPTSSSFCRVPECGRETTEGRSLCWGHQKRKQRGLTGDRLDAPIREALSPAERLNMAGLALADCPSDDDAEYARLTLEHQRAARAFTAAHPREEQPTKANGLEQLALDLV